MLLFAEYGVAEITDELFNMRLSDGLPPVLKAIYLSDENWIIIVPMAKNFIPDNCHKWVSVCYVDKKTYSFMDFGCGEGHHDTA